MEAELNLLQITSNDLEDEIDVSQKLLMMSWHRNSH